MKYRLNFSYDSSMWLFGGIEYSHITTKKIEQKRQYQQNQTHNKRTTNNNQPNQNINILLNKHQRHPICSIMFYLYINWLVVSTHLKNISQNGNLPQIGVKITNIWNHRLDKTFKQPTTPGLHLLPQRNLACNEAETPSASPAGFQGQGRFQSFFFHLKFDGNPDIIGL